MYDVVIIGGGLVGSAFALDLAIHSPNLNICIIDKGYATSNWNRLDNRVYTISASNLAYLRSLGVILDNKRINPVTQMLVYGDHNGHISLSANDVNQSQLATIVEYKNIQNALLTELKHYTNVTYKYQQVEQITNLPQHVELGFANDTTTISAKLLVAADGANSFVLNYFQFHSVDIDYSQSGVIGNLTTEYSHKNIAYQWFLPGGDILALLPLPNNTVSIVYSTHNPNQLLELSSNEFCDLLYNLSSGVVGKLHLIDK